MSKAGKVIWGIIAVAIIVAIFIAGSGRENKEAIKIGAIIGLTGNYQDVGENIRRGIDLGITYFSESNSGKKVGVIYEDSRADTKTAIEAYRKLVDIDGVKIVIVSHSNIALALAPLAEKDRVILFAIYAVATGIPEAGDYIFRNDINLNEEMKEMAAYIFNKGFKRVALLSVNTEGSIASTKKFIREFTSLGGEVAIDEKYGKDESDYRSYLVKIKEVNPDAVFSVSAPKQMGLLINQAKTIGISLQFFADWHTEGFELINLAKENANDLIYSHTFDQNSNEDTVKDFVDKYKSKYNIIADYRSALAYDTFLLLANAIKKCSGDSTDCVKNHLLKVKDYKGVTGITTIDENGDTDKPIIIKIVKNGQFVKLEK